jgi:hypothetical protein
VAAGQATQQMKQATARKTVRKWIRMCGGYSISAADFHKIEVPVSSRKIPACQKSFLKRRNP